MFTGIVAALGQLKATQRKSGDVQLTITSEHLDFSDVKLGDSIAVNGVCLTVTSFGEQHFCADVSTETLSLTSLGQLKAGSKLNLEKAMQLKDRFGGHIVSGHVDGLAEVVSLERSARAVNFWIKPPQDLARYIAHKGSITVDGISLTVNEIAGDDFRLTIIPHTAEQTTISEWQAGRKVNLEVDVLARYLERLLEKSDAPAKTSKLDRAFLAEHGFVK